MRTCDEKKIVLWDPEKNLRDDEENEKKNVPLLYVNESKPLRSE